MAPTWGQVSILLCILVDLWNRWSGTDRTHGLIKDGRWYIHHAFFSSTSKLLKLLLSIVIWFISLSGARSLVQAFLIRLLHLFSFVLNFLVLKQLSLSFGSSIFQAWLYHGLTQTLREWIVVFISLNDLKRLSKRHLRFAQHHISHIGAVPSAVWFLIGFVSRLFGAFSASFGCI